jgi:hypothetical protein
LKGKRETFRKRLVLFELQFQRNGFLFPGRDDHGRGSVGGSDGFVIEEFCLRLGATVVAQDQIGVRNGARPDLTEVGLRDHNE